MKARVAPGTREKVLITAQIAARPSRGRGGAAEKRALGLLGEEVAHPAGNVWERLCEHALDLCAAHSAGISILEFQRSEAVFRWHAVAGKWACYVGGCLPRDASPCGVAIDLEAPQLMRRPAKAFPLLRATRPEPVEALVAPFKVLGEGVGAVWVLAHDEKRKFDSEDARLLASLASFAASAFLNVRSETAASNR